MRPWGGGTVRRGPSLPLPVREGSHCSPSFHSARSVGGMLGGQGGWYLLISQRLHWQTQDKRCLLNGRSMTEWDCKWRCVLH